MNQFKTSAFAVALGTFAAVTMVPVASANPFAMTDLAAGYQLDAPEGKCGEGKCGGEKKEGEGKCGEGKCGAEKKGGEGKCGAEKKDGEGKCGEGKCGGGMA
ncbi:MAG: hypothetical protein II007_13785 [Gammaproteobacteria bacterium]|nr:hypothetical protein [Gammaproteobacteria bacterium]